MTNEPRSAMIIPIFFTKDDTFKYDRCEANKAERWQKVKDLGNTQSSVDYELVEDNEDKYVDYRK